MSWRDICPMDEKVKFIASIKEGALSFSAVCKFYGISRKTGYKWLSRYEEEGPKGLYDQKRARYTQSHQAPQSQVKAILKAKNKYKDWGPKKVKSYLEREYPNEIWPAASTVGDILKKNGLVEPRTKRRHVTPYTQPFLLCTRPNDVWSADFKGQFKTNDKKYCYPFTVTDNYSRFIITCDGYLSPSLKNVQKSMIKAFKEYGLPKAIRTDNGTPFASTGAGGLSRLSIWWVKLNIYPERIDLGRPEQNGRHERMHRTLKKATALPAKKDLANQNKAFEVFVKDFNYIRPHEALENHTPFDIYEGSCRQFPSKLPEIQYSERKIVRKVRSNGQIKLNGNFIFISELLYGEPLALEQVEDGYWDLQFGNLGIGIIDERLSRLIKYDKYYD